MLDPFVFLFLFLFLFIIRFRFNTFDGPSSASARPFNLRRPLHRSLQSPLPPAADLRRMHISSRDLGHPHHSQARDAICMGIEMVGRQVLLLYSEILDARYAGLHGRMCLQHDFDKELREDQSYSGITNARAFIFILR